MRLARCPTTCIRKLRHGEARRVPNRDAFRLVGYYLGCPVCGRPQCYPAGDVTYREEGMDVGEVPRLTMSRAVCADCGAAFRVERDEIVVEASC